MTASHALSQLSYSPNRSWRFYQAAREVSIPVSGEWRRAADQGEPTSFWNRLSERRRSKSLARRM